MAADVPSSTQGYSIAGNIVMTKPTGVAIGDVLVLFCYGKWNSGFNASCTGFTVRISNSNGGESMTVLSRTATSGDVSASTYTVNAGQSEIMGCVMLRCTGVTDDWTTVNSQVNVANGIFNNADITPLAANSLLLFGAWNVPFSAATISGFAIVTSNPTWNVAQQIPGNNGNAIGPGGLAWAVRPQTTSTGDFSITDPGTDQQCCVASLPATAPVGPANVKTVNNLALASVKTINGLATASVKTVNGLN